VIFNRYITIGNYEIENSYWKWRNENIYEVFIINIKAKYDVKNNLKFSDDGALEWKCTRQQQKDNTKCLNIFGTCTTIKKYI